MPKLTDDKLKPNICYNTHLSEDFTLVFKDEQNL